MWVSEYLAIQSFPYISKKVADRWKNNVRIVCFHVSGAEILLLSINLQHLKLEGLLIHSIEFTEYLEVVQRSLGKDCLGATSSIFNLTSCCDIRMWC